MEQQQENAFIQGKILQSRIIIIVAIVNAMGVRRARAGVLPDEPQRCFGRYIGSFPKNKPEKAAHRIKVKNLSQPGAKNGIFCRIVLY